MLSNSLLGLRRVAACSSQTFNYPLLPGEPKVRKILTAPEKPIHIRRIMDEGKIGDDAASLLEGLLVTTMGLAAFSRAEIPEHGRRPFYVYVDEFQNFTTLSVANMVAELPKYRVGITFAHQHLPQLDREVQHAVLGNAGTIISFRLGPSDGPLLAREFAPWIGAADLLNLSNQPQHLLMIDRVPS